MLSNNSSVICINSPGLTSILCNINFSSDTGFTGIFTSCSRSVTVALGGEDVDIEDLLMSLYVAFVSRSNPNPKPESIRRLNVLSSSGESGINVPTTIESTSGDLCTICNTLSLFCNNAKLPHPRYTRWILPYSLLHHANLGSPVGLSKSDCYGVGLGHVFLQAYINLTRPGRHLSCRLEHYPTSSPM